MYVLADGNVRFTFAHPKQILEILRLLCTGKTEPIRELCILFDRETDNGANMRAYSALLEKAVAAIAATFRRRAGHALQASRSAVLVPQSAQPTDNADDFELITWVVIKASL